MSEDLPGSTAGGAAKEKNRLLQPRRWRRRRPARSRLEIRDHEVVIELGERRWRVRGLARNLSYEQLKINLLVAAGEHFFVDILDLYSSRQRASFLKQAAIELQVKREILSKDLGRVLMKLEEIQEERITKELEPEENDVKLSEEERTEALELLKDPRLLDRVSEDLTACGLVGEHTNKLTAYLATVSRKLSQTAGGDGAVVLGGGEVGADGRGAGLLPGGGAGAVLGDDRPEPLLHGRDGPQAEGAGDRRGGGRRASLLRLEASSK